MSNNYPDSGSGGGALGSRITEFTVWEGGEGQWWWSES